MMDPKKKAALEAAGWKSGTIPELFEMTSVEEHLFEMKVQLAKLIKNRRQYIGLSQTQLAAAVNSSQSRIANAEILHKSASVSMDMLVKCALATGVTVEQLAQSLTQSSSIINQNRTLGGPLLNTYSLGKREAASDNRIKNLKDVFELV